MKEKIKKILRKKKPYIIMTIVILSFSMMIKTIEYNRAVGSSGMKEGELELLHKMANTVIVSDEIWGTEKITMEKVDKALKFSDDEIIIEYLKDWKNGDFSESDNFHNYVWEMLGGTTGRARGLNYEEIHKLEWEFMQEK